MAQLLPSYPSTVTKVHQQKGDGTVTGEGIDCGLACKASYAVGTQVTLTATPATGSTFLSWSGGGCSGTGMCTVTMGKATTVKATFEGPVPLTVTKVHQQKGDGTVTGEGIDCGSTCKASYTVGTQVVLSTATPATGSTFLSWSGGGCSGTGMCTVTMGKATTVKATFEGPVPLTVTKVHQQKGDGTVTGEGIDCGSTCKASYTVGTQVTLPPPLPPAPPSSAGRAEDAQAPVCVRLP